MSNENIYYKKVKFPSCEIYIFGAEFYLYKIQFANMFDKGVEKNCKKGTTREIEKGILFLTEYFSGKKSNLQNWQNGFNLETRYNKNRLNLNIESFTEIERKVYRELIKIGHGDVISYGRLSEHCGIKNGGRFIGNTMAKNHLPILIPCHRVIRSDGEMGNYTGGTDIKTFLLKHENADIIQRG